MRISDWSSDVCSSDLQTLVLLIGHINCQATHREPRIFVILHIITNVGMREQPLEDDQLRSLLLSAKRWARSRMTSACAAIDSRASRPGTFKSRPNALVTASASCDARRRTNGAATHASA